MAKEVSRLEPGDKAPLFSLTNQDNESVTSQESPCHSNNFLLFSGRRKSRLH